MRRLLLGTMLILALAVPTLAEDPPAKVRGIDKPVSLEFKDHPVGKVVEAIARFAELNVILSPDVVKERVTVSFRGVPAGKALEQVAEAAGAGFVEEAHGIFRMVKKDKLQRVEADQHDSPHSAPVGHGVRLPRIGKRGHRRV